MASAGISRTARVGSRYNVSVASSAASVSLSTRSARAIGCRRSASTARIPSSAVTIGGDVERVESSLRRHAVPVIATIREGRLRLDLRSIPAEQDALLTRRVAEAVRAAASDMRSPA